MPSHLKLTERRFTARLQRDLCSLSVRLSPVPHVHTAMHAHTGPVFWFPGLPYCPLTVFNKCPLCICACARVFVCRLIRQPPWLHVTTSMTLLSTTDHPASPRLLQGNFTHTLTQAQAFEGMICTNLHPHMPVLG